MRCPNYIVMKKILITIIGLFSIAYGQLYQSMPQRGYGPVKNFWVDSVLIVPTNVTGGSNLSGGREVGKIRYNITDSSLQAWTGYQWRGPAGSGTLTNFSAGNLSPLFTSSVATSTSTPALTFALTNTSQYKVFGRKASGSGAPSYLDADSSLITALHSEDYYNTKYLGISATVPLSRIAAATGSNSIDNLNYLQTWAWNTHTGLFPAFIINRTSTALGASGGPMLSIVSSGANASANAVAQGLSISVTNTGTSSSNAALQLAASGATNNTALQINNGDIVLTPLTASRPLKLNGSKVITSGLIDIASSNDVTGVLPIANGGTNNASLPVTAGTVYFGDGSKITGDNANFFWDNSNKRLGIGTTSPSQKLHVQGSGTTGLFKSTGYSASTVIIEDPDGTTYITNGQFRVNSVPFVLNANASYISLQTAGVERARVLNTGEVGVGTSTPNSTLHVAGSLSLSYKFVEDDNYEITATDYTLSVHNGENNWTIILPDASTCQGRIYIIKRYDNNSTGLVTVDANSCDVQDPGTGSFNTTFDLTAWGTQNQSVMFQSNGINWEAIK